jgi:hypothetical protein
MAARLLAAVSRPNAAECTKGRFFDYASDKLRSVADGDVEQGCPIAIE